VSEANDEHKSEALEQLRLKIEETKKQPSQAAFFAYIFN